LSASVPPLVKMTSLGRAPVYLDHAATTPGRIGVVAA